MSKETLKIRILLALLVGVALFGRLASAETLIAVYKDALQNDPNLSAKAAALAATEETIHQSAAELLPAISLTAHTSDNRQKVLLTPVGQPGAGSFNQHGYLFSLRQPVFRFDRWVDYRQAKKNTRRAQKEYKTQQIELLLNVAEQYFAVLAAQNTLGFIQKEKASIAKQLENARVRFDVGSIAVTDVLEVEARFDQSVANEIAAEYDVKVQFQQLKEITNKIYPVLARLDTNRVQLSPTTGKVEDWVERSVNINPEIKALNYNVTVKQLEIDKQRAGHLPSVDFVASAGYTVAGGRFGDFKSKDELLGIEASISLFESGAVLAKTKAARFQYKEAKMQLEAKKREIERLTRAAYLNIHASISRIKALIRAVSSSAKALEATDEGYKVGSRTIIDLLNAQTTLHRTERDLAQGYYNYITYQLQLKHAAGSLAFSDIEVINDYLIVESSGSDLSTQN